MKNPKNTLEHQKKMERGAKKGCALAIALILLGFGVLQVGLPLQSHDLSQRSNGMLTIAGGIVITLYP